MMHSVKFIAILDTNVIYPIIIRDLLFWFAYYELYTPKWSDNIFCEWKAVMLRKGVDETTAEKRIGRANQAFPDAQVKNYQPLVAQLTLPDVDDCHVLAAAIKADADVIVTNNLKDFPKAYIESLGLTVKSADDFLTDIIDLNQDTAVKAFKDMVLNRKNPAMDEYEVLESFRKIGLQDTANCLHALL